MQTWSSNEKAVRLSVKRVDSDKIEERSVEIFIPCESPFSVVFWEDEWLVAGGVSALTWNFGSTGPHWSEIADFIPMFARMASAVTPCGKSLINTNRKSTTRFPVSPRWTSYTSLSPQRVAQKCKVSKIQIISCDNSVKVGDRMSVTINH